MADKKFCRVSNGKIAGVCGGIAKYLNLDVTLVRIIFLILLICGSLGFWAYLICWLVAPVEQA
ncbi:MAG: PspC domain-containing protein [Tidjanibacter sp.]|nr:PspC domain-containing protein [Tidjanibacter sp.]MBR6830638.1 PspC domain-containing protein [Tidjanibacter sp.]